MSTNRIHSKGEYTQEEYVAGEAGIYPGMLVELRSDNKVYRHSVENGRNEKMFATEDPLQGRTVSDVYAIGAIVTVILPHLGCEVWGLLEDTQDVVIGDWLVSRGNGLLKKQVDDSGSLDVFTTGVVMEALDLSGSATVNGLVRLRCACH